MDQDQDNIVIEDAERPEPPEYPRPEPQRGFIAEWTVTIILLLFGTTTLVQAFVIPTGSMEDTLLIGDHLLNPIGWWCDICCPICFHRCSFRRHSG